MGVNGTFFNAKNVAASKYTPATFPLRNPSGKGFQLYLTSYLVNTLGEAGFSTGNTLDITYYLNKLFGLNILTDMVGLAIPEVLAKYGDGRNVTIEGKFITAPSTCAITTTGNELKVNLGVTLKV